MGIIVFKMTTAALKMTTVDRDLASGIADGTFFPPFALSGFTPGTPPSGWQYVRTVGPTTVGIPPASIGNPSASFQYISNGAA